MRREVLFAFAAFTIILLGSFASAMCCEKLKNSGSSGWCQTASSASQCDNKYYVWTDLETCDSAVECFGTCVNTDSGECSENTAKTQCETISKGTWYDKMADEITACKDICCVMGEDAYFVNPTECKALFTEYNIQGTIRTDITTREGCEELITSVKKGACVVTTELETTCVMTLNTECDSDNEKNLVGNLQYSYNSGGIDFEFHEGLLCTAEKLNTNCAKSEETECKDNKVYYKDTCGNFANVYDTSKYTDDADYWTYMKDAYDATEVCTVSASGSNKCGNCDATENTVCENYKESSLSKPTHNTNGLVCGDLSCTYNGKKYEHGESWCAGTDGTFIIQENLTTGEIFKSNLTALQNESKYNLPGSKYYKLLCSYGEVLVEECGDYRNSICVEGKNDQKESQASCTFNSWRTCFELESRTDCENSSYLCKWVDGYRWDGVIVSEANRKEYQGSCVPLVAPGYDFWEAATQGNSICEMGTVQEYALFETAITVDRNSMSDWSTQSLSNRCVNGCYSLPDYAKNFNQVKGEEKSYPEDVNCESGEGTGVGCNTMYEVLTEFYDESEFSLEEDVGDYYLSTRRGQYCHKSGNADRWLTGKVKGSNYDCTPGLGSESKDEEKERDYPIYLTNQEWINSITERARSLGDCGYKAGVTGEYNDPEAEIITAIFQKLSQKGNVKENITVEQIIYKGGKYIKGELYETTLPYESKSYTCASDYGGVCTSTLNNAAPCTDGEQSADATCPANSVCCIYSELI